MRKSLLLFICLLPTLVFAQSEEKSFKNSVAQESKADACAQAKSLAQDWLKENTDRSHSYFLMNQAKRGWSAKSDGTGSCECSAVEKRYSCTVDAKVSAIK